MVADAPPKGVGAVLPMALRLPNGAGVAPAPPKPKGVAPVGAPGAPKEVLPAEKGVAAAPAPAVGAGVWKVPPVPPNLKGVAPPNMVSC